ncbi:hypothetical protein [Pseudoduganella sp. UC29_71]|jgi:hypothetical protein
MQIDDGAATLRTRAPWLMVNKTYCRTHMAALDRTLPAEPPRKSLT